MANAGAASQQPNGLHDNMLRNLSKVDDLLQGALSTMTWVDASKNDKGAFDDITVADSGNLSKNVSDKLKKAAMQSGSQGGSGFYALDPSTGKAFKVDNTKGTFMMNHINQRATNVTQSTMGVLKEGEKAKSTIESTFKAIS